MWDLSANVYSHKQIHTDTYVYTNACTGTYIYTYENL